jgi:hypothetical protein
MVACSMDMNPLARAIRDVIFLSATSTMVGDPSLE